MTRPKMYAAVTGVTYGVGEFLVDLMTGKVDSRSSVMVLALAGLMTRAAMPWLLVSVWNRLAEQVVEVHQAMAFRDNRDVDWTRAIQKADILCQNRIIRYTCLNKRYTCITQYIHGYDFVMKVQLMKVQLTIYKYIMVYISIYLYEKI